MRELEVVTCMCVCVCVCVRVWVKIVCMKREIAWEIVLVMMTILVREYGKSGGGRDDDKRMRGR